MAKNKTVFQSNNSKNSSGQTNKVNEPNSLPKPQKAIRGNSRGK